MKRLHLDAPSRWHSEKGRNRNRSQKSGAWDGTEGEMGRWSKGFLGQWNYSVWHCNSGHMTWYTWQNPSNCTIQKVNPKVNYGFYIIIVYQYWFNFNIYNTLIQDANKKEICTEGLRGTTQRNPFVLSAQPFCKLKTALKNSLLMEKKINQICKWVFHKTQNHIFKNNEAHLVKI